MKVARLTRGGTYYRVCDPSWTNPANTAFSKRHGGRWNPPGEFGALYLNETIDVAAANARRSIRQEFGDAVTFADLRPDQRPDLQSFIVRQHDFVDALTTDGIAKLGLPATYPEDCGHTICQGIARELYAGGEAGVIARSAIADGAELAIFDSHRSLARRKPKGREPFHNWYPGFA